MEAHFPQGTQAHDAALATGIRMRWYERGAGDVILFLHGFPELALSYREQFVLSDAGYRCVAPDLRGYGGTDAPRRVRDYAMPSLVADTVSLIEALAVPRVHLVAHDWGGIVGWETARARPDLVRTLTILNCPPPELMRRELMTNPRQVARSWYMGFFQLPLLPERLLLRDATTFMVRAFRSSAAKENRKLFTRELVAPYAAAHAKSHLAGINYYRAALRAPWRTTSPRLLTMPAQLVWGVHDAALGPWFAERHRYRDVASDFRVVLVEDAGHWVQQERPERVNQAIAELVARG